MSELDNLLESLRAQEPGREDIARWKRAVDALVQRPKSRWVELVAAMLVGVIIGGTLFKQKPSEENAQDNATIERIVTKIE